MTDPKVYVTRRSVLYMPASNERALAKARSLPVDGVILDLEDAVAPQDKEVARENACAAARSDEYGYREVTIRINAVGTAWHEEDLRAAAAAAPAGVLVPKVDSADQVRRLAADLERAGAPEGTRLWAMIETPGAILRASEIATASDRLAVLVLGTNDLVKELRSQHVPGRAPLQAALQLCLLAARAAGLTILDGVYNDVGDAEGFRAECEQGRDLGFDGKTLIHPAQVEAANAVYAPSDAAVEEAEGILEAWERGAGAGVLTYRGKMIESLHVDTAREVLQLRRAIDARHD